MLAIKGGPACDCEVEFIVRLMDGLGAQVEKAAVPQANGKYLLWRWWLARPGPSAGVGRMMVSMYQYDRVEHARPDLLESDFWASRDYVEAPRLARVAVVSAPADVVGSLNEQLRTALSLAQGRAERRGFRPEAADQGPNPAHCQPTNQAPL